MPTSTPKLFVILERLGKGERPPEVAISGLPSEWQPRMRELLSTITDDQLKAASDSIAVSKPADEELTIDSLIKKVTDVESLLTRCISGTTTVRALENEAVALIQQHAHLNHEIKQHQQQLNQINAVEVEQFKSLLKDIEVKVKGLTREKGVSQQRVTVLTALSEILSYGLPGYKDRIALMQARLSLYGLKSQWTDLVGDEFYGNNDKEVSGRIKAQVITDVTNLKSRELNAQEADLKLRVKDAVAATDSFAEAEALVEEEKKRLLTIEKAIEFSRARLTAEIEHRKFLLKGEYPVEARIISISGRLTSERRRVSRYYEALLSGLVKSYGINQSLYERWTRALQSDSATAITTDSLLNRLFGIEEAVTAIRQANPIDAERRAIILRFNSQANYHHCKIPIDDTDPEAKNSKRRLIRGVALLLEDGNQFGKARLWRNAPSNVELPTTSPDACLQQIFSKMSPVQPPVYGTSSLRDAALSGTWHIVANLDSGGAVSDVAATLVFYFQAVPVSVGSLFTGEFG